MSPGFHRHRALCALPRHADPGRFGCRQLPVHRAQFEETHSAGPHLCGETRWPWMAQVVYVICHMCHMCHVSCNIIYIYIIHVYMD